MFRFLLVITVLISSLPSMAADQSDLAKADGLVSDWESWLGKHDISQASIAVSLDGEMLRAFGEARSPDQVAPIGSVTKMITGICAILLERKGSLDLAEAVSTYVPELKSGASIGSLLKQTAGYVVDPTQGGVDHYPGFDNEFLVEIARRTIEQTGDKRDPGRWHYNNGNYAMVGAAISAVTGQSYEQACGKLVLEPAGIETPSLLPDWRIMSSWGGWRLSAIDMVRFMDHYFTNDTVAGVSPESLPHHQFGNGLNYGLGYMFRKGRHGGFNFFHDGRWHVDHNGRKYRWGAYLVRFDNGWTVAANHNISALNGEHGELDQLIAVATHKTSN